jgi:hypothetical protein
MSKTRESQLRAQKKYIQSGKAKKRIAFYVSEEEFEAIERLRGQKSRNAFVLSVLFPKPDW